MKRRILFTARDVGAAHQIKHIVKTFKKNGYRVWLVGSGVALKVFKEERLCAEQFSINGNPTIPRNASSDMVNKLLRSTYKVIDAIKPEAVFCGLSTLDLGIDEAVLYWAASKRLNIPAFQFLDTWGTFNHLKDGYPDIYFAIDRATERLGYGKGKAPMRIVGSPKHFAYATRPLELIRKKTRKKMKIKDEDKLIGYFGQLPDVPGHFYNFRLLVEAVIKFNKIDKRRCKLLIRPHPAYTKKYEQYWNFIKQNNVETVSVNNGLDIEALLCACDIVATCYSTVAVDHAYLNCYSKRPIGVVIYLLCGNDLKEYLIKNFGYWKNPLLEEGIGFFVEESNKLLSILEFVFNNYLARAGYFKTTKSLFTDNPCEKILKKVSAFLR